MPMIATVYRATDARWNGTYPYRAIAPYVDAFAPMVYWGCVEPGAATLESVQRLAALKPVHVIGQGYDAAPEGGRDGAPSAEETVRFLDVAAAQRGGGRVAVGVAVDARRAVGRPVDLRVARLHRRSANKETGA